MTNSGLLRPFLSQQEVRARGEGFTELVVNSRSQQSPATLANRTKGILEYQFNLVSVLTVCQRSVTIIQYDGCGRITRSYIIQQIVVVFSIIDADTGEGVSYLILNRIEVR